jgi:hypothetical protein
MPPGYDDGVEDKILAEHDPYNTRPATGVNVIPADHLEKMGETVKGGIHTTHLAFIVMTGKAQKSIKFSQRDMLPVILQGVVNGVVGDGGGLGLGITNAAFDDTWTIFGSIVKATSRNVNVFYDAQCFLSFCVK